MTLPPSVQEARVILAELGPQLVAELEAALRGRRFVVSTDRLADLPTRWPDEFALTDDGRICLVHQQQAFVLEDHEAADEVWWRSSPQLEPIALGRVVVIDIETTGLDAAVDEVLQVAAVDLATDEVLLHLVVDDSSLCLEIVEVLRALDVVFAEADAVAGQRVAEFDLPFLSHAAVRNGIEWSSSLPVLDAHRFSMLALPTLADRSLSALCDHFAVTLDTPHQALPDATATAGLIRALIGTYEADDPAWALAWRCLAEADDPWARVLEPGYVPESLSASLTPAPDLLAQSGRGQRYPSARGAANDLFRRLGDVLPGTRPRASQLDMARSVADAMDGASRLAVEAPTGTGKTLAYLIPAIGAATSGTPVVLATATKVLQRQLRADAERLRAAGELAVPFRQIYGVANYLCPRDIAAAVAERDARGSEWWAIAVAVRALATTPNGVWDDVTDGLVARSDLSYKSQRAALHTTSGSCERWHCDFVDVCPLFLRLPRQGDNSILSVNHALIAAWARQSPVAPEASESDRPIATPVAPRGAGIFARGDAAIVFDEAHNLEDSLSAAWTTEVGALDLTVLRHRIWGRRGPVRPARNAAKSLGDPQVIRDALARLDGLAGQVDHTRQRLGVATGYYLHEFGGEEQQVVLLPGVVSHRDEYRAVRASAAELVATLRAVRGALRSVRAAISAEAGDEPAKSIRRAVFRLFAAADDLDETIDTLGSLLDLADPHRTVHLLAAHDEDAELSERWLYRSVPIDVASRFAEGVADRSRSLVLTSATLRVGETFDFLANRLGLSTAPDTQGSLSTLTLESPFDHDEQSALILTSHLAVPIPATEQEFVDDLAADQVGFLSLSKGRALVLFAARKRMEEVAGLVSRKAAELSARGVEILVQGEDSPDRLRRRFVAETGTVLYGLRSYWEGFDAPGETLSYLIIEKPPWPHPGDPIAAARQRAIADQGGDPFLEYVVPRTAIALAQGFGRLVRSETDRGVAIICDRRLQLPTSANHLLLSAIPTSNHVYAIDRDEVWSFALQFVTGEAPDLADAIVLRVDELAEILDALRLLPGEDPTTKLEQAASKLFGIDALAPAQLDLMRAVLAGRDSLGFLPTGFGKSLCFQLPALLHPEQKPFVVISPLVALIKDQVDELRSRRRMRQVRGITGASTGAERTEILRDLAEGKIRLLYVSPERLVTSTEFAEALSRQALGGLVVDEAHCVSSWGFDFRPEFRQISKAVLHLDRSPRMGLTATATPEVERDLVDTLQLDDPLVVRQPVDRHDLRYWVTQTKDDATRTRELLRFLVHHGRAPGIVYASRRALTEELAWILRQAGYTARAYHAGMVPEQRVAVQDDFLSGTTQVIVATKAFGMGINKSDVEWVVHYDAPEALESYAQEAGRAARARDLSGDCLLLFTKGDLARREHHLRRRPRAAHPGLAQRLMDQMLGAPTRGEDRLVDADETADTVGLDPDELSVAVAWLEGIGALERKLDATMRAWITVGEREPPDQRERRAFVDLLKTKLKVRVGARRQFELEDAATRCGLEADALERLLIDWSMRRMVTYQPTQRAWRIAVKTAKVDTNAYATVVARWTELERNRLRDLRGYATGGRCRRATIASCFGDEPRTCLDSGAPPCDVCSASSPPWYEVPLRDVPDPEHLIDIRLVVLQAIGWSTRHEVARYGEVSLKAAISGKEALGEGRPLAASLLGCPQFGALRYLRSKDRRLDATIETLIGEGLMRRVAGDHAGRPHMTLELTDSGRATLGHRRG